MMNTISKCSCGSRWDWLTDEQLTPCSSDDPCRFNMRKEGEGNPPIPNGDFVEGFRLGYIEGAKIK